MFQGDIRELHIVNLDHLLDVQIYAVSFETGQREETASSFQKKDT
jgi:hypothetical protein